MCFTKSCQPWYQSPPPASSPSSAWIGACLSLSGCHCICAFSMQYCLLTRPANPPSDARSSRGCNITSLRLLCNTGSRSDHRSPPRARLPQRGLVLACRSVLLHCLPTQYYLMSRLATESCNPAVARSSRGWKQTSPLSITVQVFV